MSNHYENIHQQILILYGEDYLKETIIFKKLKLKMRKRVDDLLIQPIPPIIQQLQCDFVRMGEVFTQNIGRKKFYAKKHPEALIECLTTMKTSINKL